ncbi:TPA: DUF977 family protein [Escherichia coli]|nr:DUF977 family protein [Escherichia coli]
MAKVFTPEQREELKVRIVALVRLNGRGTFRQLATETGASKTVTRLCRELVVTGAIFELGYGLFPTEQARKEWQNSRKKLSREKAKKSVDPELIWTLPDGEIRRYDRCLNIICRECRKSEVMKRVLMFYRGNNGAVKTI